MYMTVKHHLRTSDHPIICKSESQYIAGIDIMLLDALLCCFLGSDTYEPIKVFSSMSRALPNSAIQFNIIDLIHYYDTRNRKLGESPLG